MERVRGIEPPLQAWEARVLPLNYTRRDRHPTGCGCAAAARLHRGDRLPRTTGETESDRISRNRSEGPGLGGRVRGRCPTPLGPALGGAVPELAWSSLGSGLCFLPNQPSQHSERRQQGRLPIGSGAPRGLFDANIELCPGIAEVYRRHLGRAWIRTDGQHEHSLVLPANPDDYADLSAKQNAFLMGGFSRRAGLLGMSGGRPHIDSTRHNPAIQEGGAAFGRCPRSKVQEWGRRVGECFFRRVRRSPVLGCGDAATSRTTLGEAAGNLEQRPTRVGR